MQYIIPARLYTAQL